MTLPDIARLSDAFYIGGTKCGALFGEAMVVVNPALQPFFRNTMKQAGTMLAKGWLLGIAVRDACSKAAAISSIGKRRGCPGHAHQGRSCGARHGGGSPIAPPTSSSPLMDDAQLTALSETCIAEFEGKTPEGLNMVRFCTSWSTTDAEVDAVVAAIEGLPE